MAEKRPTSEVAPSGKPMKGVRLENFRDPDWQGLLHQRLFQRYPGALVVTRRPCVIVVELRSSLPWSPADETFFASMRQEGFFQRWEPLADLPPAPKHNQAVYEHIGYRVGANERLTLTQQQALLSQLHDLELRALAGEREAEEQRIRADRAEDHANRTAKTYNALLAMLDTELQIKVTGDFEVWVAEDQKTGRILARHADLAEVYRSALRVKEQNREGQP